MFKVTFPVSRSEIETSPTNAVRHIWWVLRWPSNPEIYINVFPHEWIGQRKKKLRKGSDNWQYIANSELSGVLLLLLLLGFVSFMLKGSSLNECLVFVFCKINFVILVTKISNVNLNIIIHSFRRTTRFKWDDYLWETRMIDVVVRSTKHSSAYWTNKEPNCKWTVSVSVPTVSKYTLLCNTLTCRAWITWYHCFWITSSSLLYISSNDWVKVVFRLEMKIKIYN